MVMYGRRQSTTHVPDALGQLYLSEKRLSYKANTADFTRTRIYAETYRHRSMNYDQNRLIKMKSMKNTAS